MKDWSLSLLSKKSFWKQDGLLSMFVVLAILLGANTPLMRSLEQQFYDWGMQLSARLPSDQVAVILIDENSVNNLGHWPWSRAIHAKMIDTLSGGHPKLISYTPFFFEPQLDEGLSYLYKIAEFIGTPTFRSAIHPDHIAELTRLNGLLHGATQSLDHDHKLSDSMVQANNVLLGMSFEWGGELQGKPNQALPDDVIRNSLTNIQNRDGEQPFITQKVSAPIAMLGGAAMGFGHLDVRPDSDGKVRSEPLVVRYYDQYYPALSLMLAAKSLNLDIKDIQVKLGEGVQLGNHKIATDAQLQMRPYSYPDHDGLAAFQTDSFYDVYTGRISPDKYRDKIILVGTSIAGVNTLQATATLTDVPPVLMLANSLSSILKGDYFVTPKWSKWLGYALFLCVAGYLIFILPRLKFRVATALTMCGMFGLLGSYFFLMTTQSICLPLVLPAALLVAGHLLLGVKHVMQAERSGRLAAGETAENNRMLGLAFQGQGQLDVAFDKLRKVPMDDSLMEVLYNLGLDFERQRKLNQAESVFKYIAGYDANFRDLPQRLSQARTLWDTFVLGGPTTPRTNVSNLQLDGAIKPMLGRYEIEKELGKGTMGVVYRGRDTKIGRVVAIKTMTFSQDFEADELKEVSARFFREAETAGRLSHPNIVSIYDVGEAQDLSYIAMEFLNGDNLEQYTNPDHLLPLNKVVSIVASVADALDYAHKQNVVHRDIKPANIMYDANTESVKVTDFGIARITNSSQTKTGMVFGTPSYMSPEQLAGKKIQGTSDLFSLGITLYQLACGKLPFDGESMAQLMYAIANQPHLDILTVRPDIPPCLVTIINKALTKRLDTRYANGAQMAEALRLCAASTWVNKP
ncbi:MAG: serine/threonine-protein kinase [Gallionella sp.]|nr:serine/threonine-protein kinase [Gallionella sp.]MDD4960315.1 serine/threonine-protein kinase [Gallionella sp.]